MEETQAKTGQTPTPLDDRRVRSPASEPVLVLVPVANRRYADWSEPVRGPRLAMVRTTAVSIIS
jgi:hypothetical protein